MIKVFACEEEWYPVFTIVTKKDEWTYYEKEFEVSEDLYKKYTESFVQFEDVQKELRKLFQERSED